MIDFKQAVADYKASLVIPALEATKGNIQKSAKMLAIKRTTLTMMMLKLKIDRYEYEKKRADSESAPSV